MNENYLHGTTENQRKLIYHFKDIANEGMNLVDDLTNYPEISNDYPTTLKIRRDLENVKGKLSRIAKDARDQGIILISPLDLLD